SSRETCEIGVWSVIRLCLHPALASRKAVLGGAIRKTRGSSASSRSDAEYGRWPDLRITTSALFVSWTAAIANHRDYKPVLDTLDIVLVARSQVIAPMVTGANRKR